ncbi:MULTISPECIES: cyclic nucleotide-binding domain-containing thioredoxin-disulfide reductase [Stenotrophomonas]|uniref:cyclic nucleotide-binding domain-containing thioredoxin-disulfide reductase n=1 Tax=Stenotrophomonas TaxID=40323 RepID=UPI000C9E8816|nr:MULTISPECIES: cyclic nucleotide-binding domain-containing thioredoxin-disulfide reductase [Stenotrophomonas]MCM2523600.1 FAD-dependent oxidoreductase [Stenotrophomonas maltophilia]MCU1126928.1 FAD-dependent oxidoreductase [Stenotrophomonas maltophilia]UQY96692.1 FAD-dependent oxidoreductase [Stenotrophomonas maltophilia]UXB18180.1 FAD-dependent oxidoreductase [Stenotrophomonas maltophilia]UXB34348.1 FAD-dependent oxidoreductase [Stenotrophomonas maltophilia]
MTNSTDPWTRRRAQAFPTLTQAQLEAVRAFGTVHDVEAHEVLFDVGEQHAEFIVVLSGKLRISHLGWEGEQEITAHGPGEFSGEIDMFSNRRSLVRGTVIEAGQMLFIAREGFWRLIARHADIAEVVTRAFILRRTALIENQQGNVIVVGSSHTGGALPIRSFLTGNGHPYRYVDVDSDASAETFLRELGIARADLPAVVCRGELMKRPSPRAIADCLGLSEPREAVEVYDVAVVGGGPAGLAAAVYAASEGVRVIVIEGTAPGGQAGTSSKIENYLGFPTGISGQALAGRGLTQAQKFGADVVTPRSACSLDCRQRPFTLGLDDGEAIKTRTVVIASGAEYRRLGLDNEHDCQGAGIYYGATHVEASLCEDEEVAVVGGGNSAGQAAVFLSNRARHVHMLVRGQGLADSMSSYLINRIEPSDNITLHRHTEVAGLIGNGALESLLWRNNQTGETEERPIRHLFVMIGATPNTGWLGGCLALDDAGFIKTGGDLASEDLSHAGWARDRRPFLMETDRPGVFAVGDVRSGSVKRVASAVGEGSIAVQYLHSILGES